MAEPPPASERAVALWQQFLPDGAPESTYSLPQEVHRDRDRLRADYLAWLHDVGQRPRRGRALRDRMQIRPGLSYWWMTLPADFSLEPDSPAYRMVRLMAFAGLADRLGARTITVNTRDRWLARAVTEWADATGRTVSCTRGFDDDIASNGTSAHGTGARGLRLALYRAVPPIAAARVLASMLRVPKHGKRRHRHLAAGGITFVDYLAHLGPKARVTGDFESNYWGPLIPLLRHLDEPVSWLHISGQFATPSVVRADEQVVASFNHSSGRQVHDLLHSHLTWGVVVRSCIDYARIMSLALRAGERRRLFNDNATSLSLWPVVRETYRDQFYGRTAMLNALWINLFDRAIRGLPHQRLGIYLFENQPWEMALQHSWRQAGHGELIGVAHTSALFWSTRLFKDTRDMWTHEGDAPMPWPDRVAVNGPLMRNTCSASGWPPSRMVDVEALRYQRPRSAGRGAELARPRVLVFGEFSERATAYLIASLTAALDSLPERFDVWLRYHPAATDSAEQLDPRIQLDRHALASDAMVESHLAVCGSMSSAALEAAWLGTPTVVLADPSAFISSPAEGLSGVKVAMTSHDLALALNEVALGEFRATPRIDDVFLADERLPAWRSFTADQTLGKVEPSTGRTPRRGTTRL